MTTKQSWIVTYGNAEISGDTVVHVPTRLDFPVDQKTAELARKIQPPHTIVRSNVEFEQGTVSFEAYLEEETATCVLLLPAEPGPNQSQAANADSLSGIPTECDLAAGLNILGAPYGLAVAVNWKWQPAGGVGHGSHVPIRRWLTVKVRVTGSVLDLYVDGVRVLSTSRVLKRGQIGAFFQSDQAVKLRHLSVSAHKPFCFTIMQFTPEFDVLYKDVIKPICESYGYEVVRGDEFLLSGQILEDVVRSIRDATLIIADVTPDNANVFYELGYAHAIGKTTILLSDRKRERLPFDISGFRTLFYDNTIGGKAIVESRLREHLESLRQR